MTTAAIIAELEGRLHREANVNQTELSVLALARRLQEEENKRKELACRLRAIETQEEPVTAWGKRIQDRVDGLLDREEAR